MLNDFLSADPAACVIMWQNIVEPEWPRVTILCGAAKTRFAWGITKARIDTWNM